MANAPLRSPTAGSATPRAATRGGCSPPSSSWCSRAFIVYATWAAFQNEHYTYGPYLSPFYSPELFGNSPHAWFGPKPGWWPAWLPFSPALLILPFPGLFRFTCYYYRGAYYKAFWADPPPAPSASRASATAASVVPADPAERPPLFPLRRAAVPLRAARTTCGRRCGSPIRRPDGPSFGIGVGTLVLADNVVLLGGYTLGCHSLRHVIGGYLDRLSRRPVRQPAYDCVELPQPRPHALGLVQPVLRRVRRPLRPALLDGHLDRLEDPLMPTTRPSSTTSW